ncbi:Peptidyl-prolyl cis-trans isomerase FKBP8 [Echinococcus granulosus]|uniref:peptidylprolyl isomerase n=1 Tax=Echinococcus granulosus TaxID=6210 RepID=W6UKR9_ECHGR|nr:Peptidyl-prolyl cis-trans isomerase FKBP8 [Echinococcus granulosus]EUB62130.1 Peptidyl-prolyl cis-trans isomerase FKBP8 [Echinococcus granulosus]
MVVADSGAMDKVSNCDSESLKDDIHESEIVDILGNGLVEKKVLKKGLGQGSRPGHGDSVVISYKGWLEDGMLVEEVENLSLVIGDGECIHAFDLALPLAELKEVFELKTDARFAYGDMGKMPDIPGKAKLTYHITLNECGDPPCYENMPIEERLQISNKKRERGNFYFHRNEYQYALTCYTKGVEILLKKSLTPTLCSTEALPCGSSSASFQPKDLEIKLRNNVAATQLKLEAFAAASKTCDAVLQLDPTNRKALYRKGQATIQAYEEALSLDPSSPLLRQSLQRAKMAWKSQRDRQVRALSRAFRVNANGGNKASDFRDRLKGILSRYKIAISAVVLAGLSVMLGGTLLHFIEQQ